MGRPISRRSRFRIFIVLSRGYLQDASEAVLKAQFYFLGYLVLFFKDSHLANLWNVIESKAFLIYIKDNIKREKKCISMESKNFKQYGRCHRFQRLDSPVPHLAVVEVGGRPRITMSYTSVYIRFLVQCQIYHRTSVKISLLEVMCHAEMIMPRILRHTPNHPFKAVTEIWITSLLLHFFLRIS